MPIEGSAVVQLTTPLVTQCERATGEDQLSGLSDSSDEVEFSRLRRHGASKKRRKSISERDQMPTRSMFSEHFDTLVSTARTWRLAHAIQGLEAAFSRYIQSLASISMDPTFQEEMLDDPYFAKGRNKVAEVIRSRKDSAVASACWTSEFSSTQRLLTYDKTRSSQKLTSIHSFRSEQLLCLYLKLILSHSPFRFRGVLRVSPAMLAIVHIASALSE